MKLWYWGKDGGEESTVWGFWPIEWKSVFSVALLKFVGASREAVHSHAFNSVSWLLSGKLTEYTGAMEGDINIYTPSWSPILTKRDTLHKVNSEGVSWVLTFRGPWATTWQEFSPLTGKWTTLTHGRKEV